MTRIEEGRLAFEFGEDWNIFKLDEHQFYRNQMEKVDETKAVDFLGILDGDELYLIEVKDFRGYRIENKDRLSNGSLSIELAQKVRDSLSCIIGGYRNSSNHEHWAPFKEFICNRNRKIKVILWIEHDLPNHLRQRKKAEASIQTKLFKKKLIWLTNHVLVCSNSMNRLRDLKVNDF